MRKFIYILVYFIAQNHCVAQANSIFVELGGNSLGPSLNYQRQLGQKNKLGMRLGIGSAFVSGDYNSANTSYFSSLVPDERLCVPLAMNYLIDLKNRNYLELGLGYTWINFKKNFQNAEQGTHNMIASIGYTRYFGSGKGWMWNARFTPLIGGNRDKSFVFGFAPMAGVSIGKRF